MQATLRVLVVPLLRSQHGELVVGAVDSVPVAGFPGHRQGPAVEIVSAVGVALILGEQAELMQNGAGGGPVTGGGEQGQGSLVVEPRLVPFLPVVRDHAEQMLAAGDPRKMGA